MFRRISSVIAVSGGVGATLANARAVFAREGVAGVWRRVLRYLAPSAPVEEMPLQSEHPDLCDRDCDPSAPVRLIAFYLPQYHPIPENDAWWGKGFTEWTNVTRARPNFAGHEQPQLPADLGFYDLRLAEAREAQAALARQYGIDGFCYYAYWFGGKRLLHRPLDEVISSGAPDFPFCVCWANENWTRTWDGQEAHLLMAQQHSDADDAAFIDSLFPALRDQRYIRIDGKPLLLVYRLNLLPDARRTASIWRQKCRDAGVGEIYLAAVDSFLDQSPSAYGFDAAVEFPPHGMGVVTATPQPVYNARFRGLCYSYVETARRYLAKSWPEHTWFRGVMPSWDNTARRQDTGHIFLGSQPELYQQWLTAVIRQTRARHSGDERVVFINAWNEWAEGNHLEPCQRYGHAWLEATAAAKREAAVQSGATS